MTGPFFTQRRKTLISIIQYFFSAILFYFFLFETHFEYSIYAFYLIISFLLYLQRLFKQRRCTTKAEFTLVRGPSQTLFMLWSLSRGIYLNLHNCRFISVCAPEKHFWQTRNQFCTYYLLNILLCCFYFYNVVSIPTTTLSVIYNCNVSNYTYIKIFQS